MTEYELVTLLRKQGFTFALAAINANSRYHMLDNQEDYKALQGFLSLVVPHIYTTDDTDSLYVEIANENEDQIFWQISSNTLNGYIAGKYFIDVPLITRAINGETQ